MFAKCSLSRLSVENDESRPAVTPIKEIALEIARPSHLQMLVEKQAFVLDDYIIERAKASEPEDLEGRIVEDAVLKPSSRDLKLGWDLRPLAMLQDRKKDVT